MFSCYVTSSYPQTCVEVINENVDNKFSAHDAFLE
jgi:hypothetical protein